MKRREFLKSMTALAAGGVLPAAPAVWSPAKAQARQETLLIVSESGPNNIDIHGVGTNVPGYEVSWNCYDRLISHEMKTLENGTQYYDRDKFKMELADDMNVGDMSVTFKLKKKAVFHDGTPVTAKDVKWSLDRAVTVGGFPTFQMGAGSLSKPEQFVVVDDNTIRVDFLRKDRLTVPDLAVIVPAVYNSELVKKNATEKDPWGLEYTKQNTAGSGAYRVVKLERRHRGHSRAQRQVEGRAAAEGAAHRLAHGAVRRQPARAARARRCRHLIRPAEQGFRRAQEHRQAQHRVDAVFQWHPVYRHEREDPAVRQSEGAPGRRLAFPYQKIMDAVLFGLAKPMYGAPADAPTEVAWPQPHKFNTDIAKAKALMAEAGYPNGFDTTLSFDLGFAGVNEPLCVLTQESLAQIGIKCTINKIPGATWRTELNKKVLPLYTNVFSGWLDYPEYFFIWCYHGKNSIFNTMSYQSKDMDALIDGAVTAAAEGDKASYDKDVKGFVDLAYADIPRIPLYPALRQCRDAEERVGLSVLVPPPPRLPRPGEGVSHRW